MSKDRIEKINELLEKYYDSEDSFEQTDLAIELIQKHLGWLIVRAEKTESLQQQLDAKIMFVNNGMEEYQYALQEKVIRYEEAIESRKVCDKCNGEIRRILNGE